MGSSSPIFGVKIPKIFELPPASGPKNGTEKKDAIPMMPSKPEIWKVIF